MHRPNLSEIVDNVSPPGRGDSSWSLDNPPAMIHRPSADQIQMCGENHQSLIPDVRKHHENTLWLLIEETQGLAAHEVDGVIKIRCGDLDGVVLVWALNSRKRRMLRRR